MARLTTTSYAILGLLSLRDWTTYELAKQMQRTIEHIWPRAERKLYDEPKRLVELGYARAFSDSVGNRPRTTYSITPAGRKALKKWLGTEISPPALESEGMLRVLFADQGDIAQLQRTIATIAQQAQLAREQFADMARGMLDSDGGEFPDRLHVNALGMRYMIDYYDGILGWADWALKATARWPDTKTPVRSWATSARAVLHDAAAPARATAKQTTDAVSERRRTKG